MCCWLFLNVWNDTSFFREPMRRGIKRYSSRRQVVAGNLWRTQREPPTSGHFRALASWGLHHMGPRFPSTSLLWLAESPYSWSLLSQLTPNLFFINFLYSHHIILCLKPTPRELDWGDSSSWLGRDRLWRGTGKDAINHWRATVQNVCFWNPKLDHQMYTFL